MTEPAVQVTELVGQRLRLARKLADLTLVQAASSFGITQQALSLKELGHSAIDVHDLKVAADLYGVPISFFIEAVEPRSSGQEEVFPLRAETTHYPWPNGHSETADELVIAGTLVSDVRSWNTETPTGSRSSSGRAA